MILKASDEMFKIDIEVAAQTVFNTQDRYSLGVKWVAYCAERKLYPRLAVVGQLPVVDGFGVPVAKNRGLVAEVFPSRPKALEWLSDGPGGVPNS